MSNRRRSPARGFRSILCAVDFGPRSSATLQAAADLARTSGAGVAVLYVEDPLLSEGAAAVGYDTRLLRKSTLAQLQRLTNRVVSSVGARREAWSVEVVVGRPARSIVAFARKVNADLIVMGAHGRRGPAKLFFGSVVQDVLRRSPAPVLVVATRRLPRDPRGMFTRRVVGAIEFGSTARHDAQRVARVAKMLGTPLTLLHVVAPTPGPPWLASELKAHEHPRLVAAQARLDAIAKVLNADSRVVLGDPDEEIPSVAGRLKAGLIVMTLRPGHGLFGKRQGTTTYQVLCTSTIPVLALPSTESR